MPSSSLGIPSKALSECWKRNVPYREPCVYLYAHTWWPRVLRKERGSLQGALSHTTTPHSLLSQQEEGDNSYPTRDDTSHVEILSPAFKEKKIYSCPSNNALPPPAASEKPSRP